MRQEAKEQRRCLMDGDEKGSEEEVKAEGRRLVQTKKIRIHLALVTIFL